MSEYSRNNNDIKLQIEHDNHIAILSDDQDWVIDYVIDIKEKEIQHLRQQLEAMTNKCAELNYDKNCLISDSNQSKENERQLKQQLEVENKNNYEMSAEMEHLRNQLKEAVEVIEFYGNIAAPMMGDNEECNLELGGVYYRGGKRARQFLAKYGGRNDSREI